eukprot:2462094-Rhodomonas_salina.1
MSPAAALDMACSLGFYHWQAPSPIDSELRVPVCASPTHRRSPVASPSLAGVTGITNVTVTLGTASDSE